MNKIVALFYIWQVVMNFFSSFFFSRCSYRSWTRLLGFYFLDFSKNIMSSGSYRLLNNSSDSFDTDSSPSTKEATISVPMSNSSQSLKNRYMQIAFAVTLYW